MAMLAITPEMQTLVNEARADLPSGFKLKADYKWGSPPKDRLEFVYPIRSNHSWTPIIPLATLVKIQELFGAKDVQVQAEYEVQTYGYKDGIYNWNGSHMTITVLL